MELLDKACDSLVAGFPEGKLISVNNTSLSGTFQ